MDSNTNRHNKIGDRQMQVKCPHGIVCDYVLTYTVIEGEQYVTGGHYWHDEDTRCKAEVS